MSVLQVVCLVVVIVLAIATRPPLWAVITIVACGVVFAPVGILLGKRLRPTPMKSVILPLVGWVAPVSGKRDPVALIAAGVFLVFVVLALVIERPWSFAQLGPHELRSAVVGVVSFLTFGCIAALIASAVRVMSTSQRLKAVVSRDYAQARRIRRAIYRGRVNDLEPVDVDRARATAILSVAALRWQIVNTSLLLGMVELTQLSTFVIGVPPFGYWFPAIFAVFMAITVAIVATRLSALRRYLATQ
jgi:hypothetical protein